eukprot:TRINITY_DN8205_c0_g2_i1.p1 TRINITY_DN8205_c0_g2~~TRINITY_DN8205_c0_g2_i1.p1  ORF type:complete len:342 (+),score=122.20 TRINITY_DN8205_c0_g2_i1:56-1027(+)
MGADERAAAAVPPEVDGESDDGGVQMWVGVPDGSQRDSEKADALATKLGGVPVWPQPETPERAAAAQRLRDGTACRVCGDPMYLLMQLFCPNDELARIFFVFCCNSAACHKEDPHRPWRVFRYQEPGLTAESDGEEEEEEEEEAKEGEVAPWTFPAQSVDIFEEPAGVEVSEEEELRQAELLNAKLQARADALGDDELQAIEQSGCANLADPCLTSFQLRMQRCGRQVVRWGYGGSPLWLSTAHQPTAPPPPCACGARRCFELQIMPTVVWAVRADLHPKPNRSLGDDGLDFGTAAIYSCDGGDEHRQGLFEDFIFVQPPPAN